MAAGPMPARRGSIVPNSRVPALLGLVLVLLLASVGGGLAESGPGNGLIWVTSWAGSAQGPYPVGYPVAQPDLGYAFPDPEKGARDQSFRLEIRPSLWGQATRLRFSNVFGTQPLTLDGVFVAVQASGAVLVPGTTRRVTFAQGAERISIAPGHAAWSDAVALPYSTDPLLAGRRLAVSFHVVGQSGPMTWHAKAMTTSYLSPPRAGAHGGEDSAAAFPFSTTSWYFLDAVDMAAPEGTEAIVALGDSLTDGTNSTLNGDDRWPDVLGNRLHAACGNRFAVVNAGIGGNELLDPDSYSAEKPYPGGPSALTRLQRDVLELSGVASVIWLEGINDYSVNADATPDAMRLGMEDLVRQLHAKRVRVIAATLPSALHSPVTGHGTATVDAARKAQNGFILHNGGLFDGVVDFDKATLDPATGELKAAYQPGSTIGGPGDRLHPNRAGYQAMGYAVDLRLFCNPK